MHIYIIMHEQNTTVLRGLNPIVVIQFLEKNESKLKTSRLEHNRDISFGLIESHNPPSRDKYY